MYQALPSDIVQRGHEVFLTYIYTCFCLLSNNVMQCIVRSNLRERMLVLVSMSFGKPKPGKALHVRHAGSFRIPPA